MKVLGQVVERLEGVIEACESVRAGRATFEEDPGDWETTEAAHAKVLNAIKKSDDEVKAGIVQMFKWILKYEDQRLVNELMNEGT